MWRSSQSLYSTSHELCISSHFINSLAPGRFKWNLIEVNFKWMSMIDGWGNNCEIALWWMLLHLTGKSTLVQVMAWCHQATSLYLSQCWPRSISPYGVTRPQWVKLYFGFVLVGFVHILLGYNPGTGTIMWLPQCQWNNCEEHGKINHINLW